MLGEYKKKYHLLLTFFTQGAYNTRSRLLRKFPERTIDEAIALGLIVEVRKDDAGIPIYAITEAGRSLRDK